MSQKIPKKIYIEDNITTENTHFFAGTKNYRKSLIEYTNTQSILDWIESDEGKQYTACGLIRIDKLIEYLNT